MTLIIGALLFALYQQLIIEQRYQVTQNLQAEVQRYQLLAKSVSRRNFVMQIRAADSKSALVAWQNGDEVIGALSFMPDDMPYLPKTKDFPILTAGPDKLHILTGGLVETRYGPVLISSRTDHFAALIDKFVSASATAVMLTIVFALALGYLFSKAILRRLVHYNRLSEQIEHGHYDTRLPVSWRNDEFDILANQFNKVLDTLEKNLTAIRGITDNIAHDLRTPLSHLRIGIEQLINQPAENLPEHCANLLEELDHCLSTFNAMLSLTRIEEGQQTLERQPLSMHNMCYDLRDMAEALAEVNKQTLILNLGQDFTTQGDKHLLFQAFFNLVDNAIKYSGENAIIEIRQNNNRIDIIDNGPGIPDNCKEKVFDRLVRLDPSRHHQGTGLGLSMVKAIITRHNASIHLSNNCPGLMVTIEF
ncbi:sensor histidine kinase [Parashewanella spongiae]|uniref:histidine kinase n=1 Tax=Parashewanella spongiae TaxID=342950 RepID=A0A3A6TYY1_9GAMM|nr:HAMP domain-containing sensor histidine kinase [Parashewanella spongiae]MCL1078072.1 HAMP domain-containing histidine kinase [Parashewanella spongiae]RJY16958.1 sensor histidine kinase [Parashewanella spongiae]